MFDFFKIILTFFEGKLIEKVANNRLCENRAVIRFCFVHM